ncbi:uncharacterized protein LOC131873719 [Cryptomeria japonica]|uniref:uncharacterized protein LOC131873719 n=1 Tax=Cryptomeria japonica TaxID=3369 RepID=UPI0027D9FEB8|nr:uncharacterized protein LOC131873719 [Cryptomeria japonica]
MEAFIHYLDVRMWEVVSNKYDVPSTVPTDADEKTKYELDKRARFAILCGLSKEVFVKVMYFKSANEFDDLKMNNDESVASYFLRIDEVVNAQKGLGEEIDEHDVVAKLQSTLTAYEMRIGNTPSTSKETTFKIEKQEESESELSDVFETLLVRKLRLKFQGKFKCFGCGKTGHFAAKCPYLDLSKDEDKSEKMFKKPWNPNKRLNNFKKKSLMSKEEIEDESDESNDDGCETLFMTKVEFEKPVAVKSEPDSEVVIEDVNLEEELLCALQEVKRFKKLVISYEDSNQILQLDIVNANKVIETQRSLIERKEQEISTLQKQVYTLEKQQRSTEKGETSHHNSVTTNRNQFPNNRFFHGYCHFCNLFGHKVNTCRFARVPIFGHKQSSGFVRDIRCFTCYQYGHTSKYCKKLQKPAKMWRPKLEQSMLVQIALISTKSSIWVLDSGCSHHMTGDKNKFSALENHPGGFVKFGDNTGLYITGMGTIMINKDTPINDVYYVEGLKYNLLSISQICDSGRQVVFNSYGCVIKEKSGKIIANGFRTLGNLYHLSDSKNQEQSAGMCVMSYIDENWLRHKRFGHVNFDNMVRISKNENVRGLPLISRPTNSVCSECVKGKQTKSSFKSKEFLSSRPLELVHTDLCGPMKTQSLNGEKYFMLFIDDYTRMVWVTFLKHKSEAFDRFKIFRKMVEKEFDLKLKCLRSDKGVFNENRNVMKNQIQDVDEESNLEVGNASTSNEPVGTKVDEPSSSKQEEVPNFKEDIPQKTPSKIIAKRHLESDKDAGIITRRKAKQIEQAQMAEHFCLLTDFEPQNVSEALKDQSCVDSTLYTKVVSDDLLAIEIYVDDIIFGSTNDELSQSFFNYYGI